MAPSYLSSVFKKETGQNLNRFIKSVRMEKAKDLLEQTMMKIVDISTACVQMFHIFAQAFVSIMELVHKNLEKAGMK